MAEQFETLKSRITFKSRQIDDTIKRLWTMFYDRLTGLSYVCDRAIWITNYFPTWIGIKPGSVDDDPLEEPQFCISVFVDGLWEFRTKLRRESANEQEYDAALEPYLSAYRNWVNQSIRRVWSSPVIQKLHRRTIVSGGKFGVYSTPIPDLDSTEVEQMTLLAGNSLAGSIGGVGKQKSGRNVRKKVVKRKVVRKYAVKKKKVKKKAASRGRSIPRGL
jgi:hypothetical protein